MIILNKRKDYYDYLTGIYGVDNNKVLDRKDDITADELFYTEVLRRNSYFSRNHNTYAIYIANRKYIVEQVAKGVWEFHMMHNTNTNFRGDILHKLESEVGDKSRWSYYTESGFNKNCGRVLSIDSIYYVDNRLGGCSPILSTFGFSAILPPTEVYSELDMMLGWFIDNPCKIGELDDSSKILANGFDDKISFRHRK